MLTFIAVEDPHSEIWVQLLIIVVLTLINSFLAASELSILSASDFKIEVLAKKGNKSAKLVQKLKANETKFLSTIQVGITLAGFFSSATAAVSLSEGMANTLKNWNVPFSSEIALVAVTLILSYFTLVFGELFPKRIALRSPEKIALAFAKPVNLIRILFKPIVWLLSGSCELLVRMFRLKPNNDDKVTEDEVKALVSTAVSDGTIKASEKEYINAVFTFGDLKVRDVMTPRINVNMINIDDSITKIKSIIREEKYTRFPVYKDNTDNVIGILNIKDIIISLKPNYTHVDLENILRAPLFVNEAMSADALFKLMQNNKNQSAVVIDESGSISGYVTMEDLIEEIMGNIDDEYDDTIEFIEKKDTNLFIIEGLISIQDLNRSLNLNIKRDNESYSTLAGFITDKLEEMPKIGSIVEIENMRFKVLDIENNRIKSVELFIENI